MTDTTPRRIETCTRCGVSFELRPGEPDDVLVARYTVWRETHEHTETAPAPAVEIQPVSLAEPTPEKVGG